MLCHLRSNPEHKLFHRFHDFGVPGQDLKDQLDQWL